MSPGPLSKKVGDVLALAAVVAAVLVAHPGLTSGLRPDTVYVGPGGSNWHWGGRVERPLRTVQFASEVVPAGGTVAILPGVYRERPRIRRGGTQDRPTVLKAATPGTAVLSGAAAGDFAAAVAWVPEGDGVYAARVERPVHWLTAGDVHLFRCHALAEFRELARREHQMGAFFCDADRLLRVVLPDRRPPGPHTLQTHGEIFPMGVWRTFRAANAWVEADHVRFEGLRFEFGVGAGLRLWRAAGVEVADCVFTGAAIGIAAAGGLEPARDLRVAHCLYHNFPQGEWRRRWLSWGEVYSSYASNGLVATTGDRSRIEHNLVVHGGDALRAGSHGYSDDVQIVLGRNLIAWCTDDAVEIEGDARGIAFCGNLVHDCHESLGLSPVLAGPVVVAGNLFLHPAGGLNGAQVKLLGTREPDLRRHPIRNIRIRRNVFVGDWLCWYQHPVVDVTVTHNLFAVRHMKTPPWPPGVVETRNRYVTLPAGYASPLANDAWHRLPPAGDAMRPVEGCPAPTEGPFRMTRPGPRWLDWPSLPATRRLAEEMPESFFTS